MSVSSPSPTRQKIASLEFGRVIAIFAIIGLHCQMALTYWQIDDVPWVGYVLNQASRFAVPLFFLIAGYLIQPKLTQSPWQTLTSYSKPLLKVWVVWSIICLATPFNIQNVVEHGYLGEREGYWGYLMSNPINSIMEGGLVHLWFLPALICAVLIITILLDMKLDKFVLPIALGLYIYGVLAGSYVNITELPSPFFTRNGPFFSTLLVVIGFSARKNNWSLSSRQAVLMALIGMIIHFSEAYALTFVNSPFNTHDFLFGTALWGSGIFMWLLANPNFGQSAWVTSISSRMLGIYVSHLLLVILMFNIAGALEIQGIAKDLLVYPATLVISFLLIAAIEKTPAQKWLLR